MFLTLLSISIKRLQCIHLTTTGTNFRETLSRSTNGDEHDAFLIWNDIKYLLLLWELWLGILKLTQTTLEA